MSFLWIIVGVLCLLVLICLLALVDQYRTLELIRARLNLEDNPEPISLPRDRSVVPSAIGLPSALDATSYLVVLILSTSCNTCRAIAHGMKGKSWADVWVVLEQARSAEEGAEWISGVGVPDDRTTIDIDGAVAAALGISLTPSVVLYRDGEALLAQTIPTFRQLTPLLSASTLPSSLALVKNEGRVKQ